MSAGRGAVDGTAADALAALERLTDAVGRAQGLNEIFERALECLYHSLGAKRAAVLLLDEHEVMDFVAQRGLSKAYRQAAAGHTPWDASEGDALPIVVEDVRTASELAPLLPALEREAIRAVAFVPLTYGGRLLGKFMLYYDAPRRFTPSEIQVARVVAGHIAFAVAQMRSREEVARAKDELETIFAAVDDAIAVYDADGTARYVNATAARLAGANAESMSPRATADELALAQFEIVAEDGHPLALEELPGSTALATGRKAHRDVCLRSRDTGEQRWFRATAQPVLDASGAVRFAVVILRDVTDHRNALEAAHDAQRRKDEFLAMLGHELRNPLSPIVTALSLMEMDGSTQFERERAIIGRQVRHMLRLVDDLLDVSRITRGKLELNRATVDVRDVVRRSVEMVSPLLEQRNHRVRIDLADEPLWVDGDADRLGQVLSNLLTNAAKYTEPGGSVEIHAAKRDNMVTVTVRDDGVGIEPELLPQLFDLFAQGRQRLDRSRGGLGLGLTIVRQIVELHGGRVGIASEGRGRGTEVKVRLPIATLRRSANRPDGDGKPQRDGHERRERVLVVDDNSDAADTIASTLSALGYQTAVAYDGPRALEEARRFDPDVAVLDIGLPVMDGYELARHLRERYEALRLIALTGYGQERDRRHALEAGFAQHLVKPVELPALVSAIADSVNA